jgi:hypothetical protein
MAGETCIQAYLAKYQIDLLGPHESSVIDENVLSLCDITGVETCILKG